MKLQRVFCVFLVIVITLPLPAMSSKISKKKKWLLERLGGNEMAIARSYLDDFEKLSSGERVLLYYFFRSAVAGRDIYYDQRHRHALKIRGLIESRLPDKKFEEYAKLLWANNSNYHARTGIKFIPDQFTYQDLKKSAPAKELDSLQAPIFDKSFEPVLTNLTPAQGEGDILQASANNIYDPQVSLQAVEALPSFWKTKLNVRFAYANPQIRPEVYKIRGVYGKELANVVYFLKKALPLTESLQKNYLRKLIRHYETGDEEMFRKASIDWLRSAPKIDMINGFVESYLDPRQTVGSWEGLVYYTAQDPLLKGFSENVQYFEDRMPWKDAYKRKKISSKPVATLINVAAAIGEAGPVTWGGINLPNYQDIRAKFGSKNVILSNMIEAKSQVTQQMLIDEFYLPKYRGLMRDYYGLARKMLLYMHEVIGHGSGAADPKLKGDPRDPIGKNFGAWEEARASLVAWHHIADPKLIEIGAFSKKEQADVMQAMFLLELQGQLVNLRNAKEEEVLREAHDRADQMIFEYLRQNTSGFEVIQKDGKHYVKINDTGALHEGAGQLLKIVHEAKAAGDKKTVDDFLEKYGTRFNTVWRDNIVRRAQKIGLPELVAMVFPKLIPVFKDGEVVDVRLDNGETFAQQQLRLGRASKTIEVSNETF